MLDPVTFIAEVGSSGGRGAGPEYAMSGQGAGLLGKPPLHCLVVQ